MFDIIPNTLDAIVTSVPIFASYKALCSVSRSGASVAASHAPGSAVASALAAGAPASQIQLAPWLIYWTVLALFHLLESYLAVLLWWIPFYAWLRLSLHLYLISPGLGSGVFESGRSGELAAASGAVHLYLSLIEPFLARYEADFERAVRSLHHRARQAGLRHVEDVLEYVKVQVLGFPPRQRNEQNAKAAAQGYLQSLFDSAMGSAAQPAPPSSAAGPYTSAAAAVDAYRSLSAALQSLMPGPAGPASAANYGSSLSADTGTGNRAVATEEDLWASGTLVPPTVRAEDRLSYIAAQRDRLAVLMKAFEREAGSPAPRMARKGDEALKKSRSELEFDTIEADEAAERSSRSQSSTASGWVSWGWGRSKPDVSPDKKTQ